MTCRNDPVPADWRKTYATAFAKARKCGCTREPSALRLRPVMASDNSQQRAYHTQQVGEIAARGGRCHLRAKVAHPYGWVLCRKRGSFRCGARIACVSTSCSGSAAQLGQKQQLDAHVVFMLMVLVGKLQPCLTQKLAHLKRCLTEAHHRVSARGSDAIRGFPRCRGRARRTYEQPGVLNRTARNRILPGSVAIRAKPARPSSARLRSLRNPFAAKPRERLPKRRIKPHARRLRHGRQQRVAAKRQRIGHLLVVHRSTFPWNPIVFCSAGERLPRGQAAFRPAVHESHQHLHRFTPALPTSGRRRSQLPAAAIPAGALPAACATAR